MVTLTPQGSRTGTPPTSLGGVHERGDVVRQGGPAPPGTDSRGENVRVYKRLHYVGRLFRTASNSLSGSSGGCGVSGSIGPKGILDIFEATDLKGRSLSDLGAGNGQVLFAAWFYGASNAWGLELSENPGNFFIYRAALSRMAKDRGFLELKRDCTFRFDLTGALKAGNIDQVAYVVLFGFTVCT